MTRSQFFQHFDLLAEQPDAVAKMRELVLNLAVRGKLVAQNPKDESAEILLSKVSATKERITKELRAKKLAADLPIKDEDKNRALPTGWAWAKLADLCVKLGAGSTPLGGKQVYETSGVKFLRSQNVHNDGLQLDDVAFIPPAIHKDMSGTWVQPGDILLNITGASIGRSAIVPDDFDVANVSQHVAIIRLAEKALRQFLHLVVISPDFQQRIMDVQVGVSREGLSMTRLKEFVVALPPLAEQRRIVVKVDELMALCDELEQRQQARQHARGRLQQSALHHLLAAREPQTFAAAWQRVRDHFHLLHDTPDAIPQLRQAILQLAVQGRMHLNGDSHEWQDVQLNDLTDPKFPVAYGVLKPGPHVPDGIPMVKSQHVRDWKVAEDIDHRISAELDGQFKRTKLKGGEILLNLVGASIGRCAIVPPSLKGANVSRAVAVITLKKDVETRFVLVLLTALFTPQRIEELSVGSAQPVLNIGEIRRLALKLPPLAEQKRIVARVEALLRQCDALAAQLHQTRTLGAHLLASTLHHLLAA